MFRRLKDGGFAPRQPIKPVFPREQFGRVSTDALASRVAVGDLNGDGLPDLAVATAYTDIVTERLKIFLQEHGFDVTFAKGLDYERIPEGGATQEILFKLGSDTYAKSKKADKMYVAWQVCSMPRCTNSTYIRSLVQQLRSFLQPRL